MKYLKLNFLFVLIIMATSICYSFQDNLSHKKFSIDYNSIEERINDIKSPFYYPNLIERYHRNDRNLSFEDYKYLYYGFLVFEKNRIYTSRITDMEYYSNECYCGPIVTPLMNSSISKQLEFINSMIKNLQYYPFNLSILKSLNYAYKEIGEKDSAEIFFEKIKNIKTVILSSGDGLSDSSAFFTISDYDENEILKELNFSFDEAPIYSNDFNIYSIKNNNIHKVYFNENKIIEINKIKVNLFKNFQKTYRLGLDLLDDDFEKGLDLLKQSLIYDSTNISILNKIRFTYLEKNYFDSAIVYINKLIELDKNNDHEFNSHLIDKSWYLLQNGQIDEAVKICCFLLEKQPDNIDCLNNLGLAYYYQGNFDRAEELFNKIISINPRYLYAYNNLGIIYSTKENPKAISYFESALKISKRSTLARTNLSLTYLWMKNFEKASKSLDSVFIYDLNDPCALILKSILLYWTNKQINADEILNGIYEKYDKKNIRLSAEGYNILNRTKTNNFKTILQNISKLKNSKVKDILFKDMLEYLYDHKIEFFDNVEKIDKNNEVVKFIKKIIYNN